jgi:hypothetical protein
MDKTKETYRLSLQVAAGGSGRLTRRLTQEGTLDRVNVRIYSGAALYLQLKPKLDQLHQREVDVVDYTGKQYIDGDDDAYVFDVSIPVHVDNQLIVEYVNNSLVDALDFAVDFIVDHLGGTERVG